MKFLLKRSSILILLLLAVVSFSCKKNTPVAPPPVLAPAPPPPPPPPAAPTITLSASATAINAGQPVTLTYTATNATNVTIQPGVGAVQPATTGTRQVSPAALTTYTATATGPGGTAQSAGVTITVAAARAAAPLPPVLAPPPPPVVNAPTIAQLFERTMVPVLFDYDKSSIRSSEEPKLLSMASWLKQNATVRFTVEGHADERGSQEYNIALGDDRAASVKRYLVGQGIAEARISTTSYGEERPACRAQTEDCWQQNRRGAFVMAR